jgi:hypothetical protein
MVEQTTPSSWPKNTFVPHYSSAELLFLALLKSYFASLDAIYSCMEKEEKTERDPFDVAIFTILKVANPHRCP